MDEFTVEIPGVKPIKLQAYFLEDVVNFASNRNLTFQEVTTCIIRKGGLTLGTGVAIQHPEDARSWEIGTREAFKAAAKIAGWQLICFYMTKREKEKYNPTMAVWKHLFSAWRKSRRVETEKEAQS
jgi:hypothetical protein